MDVSSIIGLGLPIIEPTSIIEAIIESIMLVISLDIAVQNRESQAREIRLTLRSVHTVLPTALSAGDPRHVRMRRLLTMMHGGYTQCMLHTKNSTL